MSCHPVWNLISLAVLPLMAVPWLAFSVTGNLGYLVILAGCVFCEALIKLTRKLPVVAEWQLRPVGAADCGICNDGGNYEGRIGMPSGHVALTTYIAVSLVMMRGTCAKAMVLAAFAVILMATSRVRRRCHTIPQVIVGALLGAGMAVGGGRFVRLWQGM